jgi:hypothetical protein
MRPARHPPPQVTSMSLAQEYGPVGPWCCERFRGAINHIRPALWSDTDIVSVSFGCSGVFCFMPNEMPSTVVYVVASCFSLVMLP